MLKSKRSIIITAALALGALVLLAGATVLLRSFVKGSEPCYIYVDADDTPDSVCHKLCAADARGMWAFKAMSQVGKYADHVHRGRYDVGSGQNVVSAFRRLRGGMQTPVDVVIPMVNTKVDLAQFLARTLEPDTAQWLALFADSALLSELGANEATLMTLFIPNTYEEYWTVKPEAFLKKMKREHDAFWTDSRRQQAAALGLSPDEVYTLASIVEKETAHGPEKPRVAGMYWNRLQKGMRLCADPTVKFALGDFSLRRILHGHLKVKSPYNTYLNEGLPPGPICLPSLESIKAVLNLEHNDYLFMCASEQFNGQHNFATTDTEHMENARRYAQALNERGIQ